MKYVLPVLLSILFFLIPAFAEERTVIFEGFDSQIVSIIDDMTDEQYGVLFLNLSEPVYMAIYGHNDFAIWPKKDDLNFAFDVKHLIRVGTNKPYSLNSFSKGNALKPINAVEAESVIQSLVKGEEIKLRYYNWPQHDKFDRKIQNPNLAFTYYKAAKLFGWKDFGVPSELALVKLDIYVPTEPLQKGSARVAVVGNPDLMLRKKANKDGAGVTIHVGDNSGFSLQISEGRWVCKSVEFVVKKHLIIRDSNGNIVFKEVLPLNYTLDNANTGKKLSVCIAAAKKALESGPLGGIEIKSIFGERALLYGFRELWKWGVDNADFPSLE